MTQKRNRGYILTPKALARLNAQIRQKEHDENAGAKLSLEKLGEMTGLDPKTVKKVLDCQKTDKKTLTRFFEVFDLTLTQANCVSVVQADQPPPLSLSSIQVLQNLPTPPYSTFFGREAELNHLLQLLSPRRGANIITVDGIGGIGKTTLVLEAAYRCLSANESTRDSQAQSQSLTTPSFDAIIFISAKEQRLTPSGIIRTLSPYRTLAEIFRQIARVIDDLELVGVNLEQQKELIEDALRQRRTLLVVDNLETVTDQEEVVSFLCELPPTVKVVVTSRRGMIINAHVSLAPMSEQDGLSLINHEAQEKGVQLEESDRCELYQVTGGVPIAINYAVGQLASGYSVMEVLQQLHQSTGDVARFCFEHSVQPLRDQPAHRILTAMTLFPAPARRDALISIALPEVGINSNTAQNALAQLRGLSLVKLETSRYSMLPLTHEYALSELEAQPEFASDIRKRWVDWYIDFSAQHGRVTIDEWSGYGFNELTVEWENLQAVMEWCITANQYSEALQLWHNLEAYTQFRGRNIGRSGYWGDRLIWTACLIEMAEQRGDWQALTQVRLHKVWTLTAIGKPELLEETENLLMESWERRHQHNVHVQVELVESLFVLYLSQDRLDEAHTWLQEIQTLLGKLPVSDNLDLKHNRIRARIPAYQGILLSKIGAHEQARDYYAIALDMAHQLNWKRQIAIMQCRLAENMAELTTEPEQLESARNDMKDGLYMADKNYDRTHAAFCKKALAAITKAEKNLPEAKRWGQEAYEDFKVLGMERYAIEVDKLILSLERE